MYQSSQKLRRILKRITERYNLNNLFHSFGCIKTTSVYNHIFSSWKHFTKGALIKSILNAYSKTNLSDFFRIWQRKCVFLSKISRKLQNVLSSTNSRLKLKILKPGNNNPGKLRITI